MRHRHRLWGAAPPPALRQRYDRDLRPGARRAVGDAARGGDGRAEVIALDVSEERLERAKEFGAAEIVNPRSNDPVGAIKDLTHGYGAEFTLDTSSQPEGRIAAVRATKVWGTTCFVGERNKVEIDVSPDMLRKQLTIVASWTFSSIGQEECARFVADRGIDVEALFTHRWKLDQADEAYKLFDTQTTGKGVFLM